MIHRIHQEQNVPASLDQVWDYFSTPENLNEMTPPDMRFEIIHNDAKTMFPGQLIEYRVQFMPVIRSRWLTEIAHVDEKSFFVDEQRIGPYRFWYHEHLFEGIEGGTRITDRVTYELPFGPLGDLAHTVWVGPRLRSIFSFRAEKVRQVFGKITN